MSIPASEIPGTLGFGDNLVLVLSRLGLRGAGGIMVVPMWLALAPGIAAFHAALPVQYKLLTMFLLVGVFFGVIGMSTRCKQLAYRLKEGQKREADWVARVLLPARIAFWGWVIASYAWFFISLDGELPV